MGRIAKWSGSHLIHETTVEMVWRAAYGNSTTTLKNLNPTLFSSVTVCHSPSGTTALVTPHVRTA